MRYFKDLDGIRAFAAFLVILCHWIPTDSFFTIERRGFLGSTGVNTFFVLSGFLISGILFQYRSLLETGLIDRKSCFKYFYLRRALRIFPVFYMLLGILLLISLVSVEFDRKAIFFNAIFAGNFYLRHIREWVIPGHLWTISVEEQFYLIWPLVVLFIRKRYLLPTILIFIAIGTMVQWKNNDDFEYLLTFTCFDAFGLGGLIAWLLNYRPDLIFLARKFFFYLAPVCIIVLLYQFINDVWYNIPIRTVQSIPVAALIIYLVSNEESKDSVISKFLRAPAISFFGKISYGVYLFHPFIQMLIFFLGADYLNKSDMSTDKPLFYLIFIIQLAALILIATLSWKYVERPILTFKKHFPGPGEKIHALKQVKVSAS